jgi:hypothetical protein
MNNDTLKKIIKRLGRERLNAIANKHGTTSTQKEYQLTNAAVDKIIRGIDNRPTAFSRQVSDSTDIPPSLQNDADGNTTFHYAIEKPGIENEVAILHDMLKKDEEYLQLKAAADATTSAASDATTSAASLAVSSSCEAKIIELEKEKDTLKAELDEAKKKLKKKHDHIVELQGVIVTNQVENGTQIIAGLNKKWRGGRKTRRKKTNKRKKKRKSKKRKRRKNN